MPNPGMIADFWLYKWLDHFDVRSERTAKRRLREQRAAATLRRLARETPYTTEPLATHAVPSITAGCGIDLTGNLDCLHWDCLKARVDDLLTHVCLYFDRVVVVGPSAFVLSEAYKSSRGDTDARVLSYIKLLLYLRKIGADKLLVFRQKPPACVIHASDRAEQAGLETGEAFLQGEIAYLAHAARVAFKEHGDHYHYTFNHPDFEHTVWGTLPRTIAKAPRSALIASACNSVVTRYLAHLASDARTAAILATPLGSTIRYHARMLERRSTATEGDVAFQIGVPILRGLDPIHVLAIRQADGDAFARFRSALRLAINERLRVAPSDRARELALQIESDILRPALADVRQRLGSAKRALAGKASLNIALGALATSCGLLTGQLPLLAAGLAGAFGALTAQQKYVDERREVGLRDMYFLWRVVDRH